MRKFILLMLVIAMLFCLIACSGKDSNTSTNTDTSTSTDTSTDTITSYVITWHDENGNKLMDTEVIEGQSPSYDYIVNDSAEWDYTFLGWSTAPNGSVLSSIPVANEDASYYAIITKTKQKYTVAFNSNGGTSVQSQVVEYGDVATLPEKPTYDGFTFVNWATDISGETEVDFTSPITGNVEYFAIWNKKVDIGAFLTSLLSGYQLNPYSYIPEAMTMEYSQNLVNDNEIISDYSSFVNISSITTGFGEQWHMVLDNIQQTQLFFNSLTLIEGLSTTAIASFNNYLDQNPSDTAHHTFESGIFSVTINFDGEFIYYVVEYTANLPVFGEQSVQIAMNMNVDSGEKVVRIQIGDANALTYTILENSYEFAIKYLGVRRAFFSIEKDNNGDVSGSIYEFLTVSEVEISSMANFYINDNYATAIGNKASGIIGFNNYICELYDIENGSLVGYEVRETLSLLNFDTLWFNLKDVSGINSIKFVESNDDNGVFYVNGSSTAWQTKKVGVVNISRRYDIEFRKQYVYSYDAIQEKYIEHEINVPMIFVQEDYYDDFTADVKSANNINVSINVNGADLQALLTDYDELVPVFIEVKDAITVDIILAYIGEKIVF